MQQPTSTYAMAFLSRSNYTTLTIWLCLSVSYLARTISAKLTCSEMLFVARSLCLWHCILLGKLSFLNFISIGFTMRFIGSVCVQLSVNLYLNSCYAMKDCIVWVFTILKAFIFELSLSNMGSISSSKNVVLYESNMMLVYFWYSDLSSKLWVLSSKLFSLAKLLSFLLIKQKFCCLICSFSSSSYFSNS